MKHVSQASESYSRPAPIPAAAWRAPAELELDHQGLICDCNTAGAKLFRHGREDLLSRHVSALFPQLADMEFMREGEPTARFRFLCSIGCGFQTVGGDGERFISELFLNDLGNPGSRHLRLIVRRV